MLFALALIAVVVALVWLGRRGRFSRSDWRPVAGVLALAALVGAVAAGARQTWLLAVPLALLAAWLAVAAKRNAPRTADGMSEEEARAALGVGPHASRAEIDAAWRRRMATAHPDRGGVPGLAERLNAARTRLTGR